MINIMAMEELESVNGGVLTEADKARMRDYVRFFKNKNYDLELTQMYWVKHMRISHVTSMTEEEAKAFIASIW